MQDLGSLIGSAMERLGMSLRDVEVATERAGHRVSYSTVSKIRTGRMPNPSRQTLQALAPVLQVPVEDLMSAVGLEELGRRFDLPQEYASRLSGAEREAVRNLVRVMAESKTGRVGDEGADSTPAIAADDDNVHELRPARKTRAAHTNRDPEIGMGDSPNET